MEDKQSLRTRYRASRDAMDAAAIESLSAQACDRLIDCVHRTWRRVAIYASVGSEVQTHRLFAPLIARGVEVLLPRCDTINRRLDFAAATGLDATRPGAYGIPEPVGPAVPMQSIDAFVLPGLAFDRRGGRLGYGAGYYDRTLRDTPGDRIGLAYASQLVDSLPTEAHDLTVSRVVTDQQVVQTRGPQGQPEADA